MVRAIPAKSCCLGGGGGADMEHASGMGHKYLAYSDSSLSKFSGPFTVCVYGASRRLTQTVPHKLAILLPVDCPQQLNHPDCLRFCGKGDVDQASSKIDL